VHARSPALVGAFLVGSCLAATALAPTPAHGQSLSDLLQTIGAGGGWVQIPVRDGHGTIATGALPTGRVTLQGCFQVYEGLTGRWEIHARDPLGDGDLDVQVDPGEPTRFSYHTGNRARLDVDVQWSEPRDTTLLLWVGLRSPLRPEKDACVPEYQKRPAADTL